MESPPEKPPLASHLSQAPHDLAPSDSSDLIRTPFSPGPGPWWPPCSGSHGREGKFAPGDWHSCSFCLDHSCSVTHPAHSVISVRSPLKCRLLRESFSRRPAIRKDVMSCLIPPVFKVPNHLKYRHLYIYTCTSLIIYTRTSLSSSPRTPALRGRGLALFAHQGPAQAFPLLPSLLTKPDSESAASLHSLMTSKHRGTHFQLR